MKRTLQEIKAQNRARTRRRRQTLPDEDRNNIRQLNAEH